MNRLTSLHATIALVCAVSLTAPALAADTALDQARQLYEDCKWPEAYAAFARLADAGDAEAARIAALMAAMGPALYGTHFPNTPLQIARWRAAAASLALASR